MARTRVLHVLTRLAQGGAQRSTLELCRRLPADRYEVEILAGPDVGTEGDIQAEFTAAGLAVHLLPGLHREDNRASDLSALWRMTGFIRRGRYDIVHTHMAKAGVIGRLAAGLAHKPVTLHTAHGWPWHNFLEKKTKERYIGYERRAAGHCEKIIVTNDKDRGKGLANGVGAPGLYTVIRSGLDFDVFDPARHDKATARAALGLPEKAPIVITVAALTAQKNPLETAQVIANAKRSFPELRWLLVGDGPLRADVQAEAERLDLGETFQWLGLRQDIPRLLAAADVFLLTSKWEGLPRTLLEAMAMGKAVVCTQVDGVLDVIEDNVTGYVRDPEDVAELTAMVVRLFRAPNLIADMYKGNTAYLRKPEFSAARMAEQTDALYQQLLRGRGLGA